MTDLNVGDRVRSFDFDGHDLEGEHACYIEGTLEGFDENNFDCRRYKIRVERRVFAGKEIDKRADHVYPPVNGTLSWLGKPTNGVEKIT